MDLALEMGQPATLLARTMPEREFRRWIKYANHKALPMRRLQLQLAQIAYLMVRMVGSGADNLVLEDFLFDPPPPKPKDELAEAIKAFGFSPRKKVKRGR